MAVTVLKNQSCSGTNIRSFFWKLYTYFAAGGALNSMWPVVGVSDAGHFVDETTLVQGDYFRIQGLSGWADGSRQEFLFGYRTSTGAIGGYTNLAAGNHCIGAPIAGASDGSSPGWVSATQTYSAPVASGLPAFPGAMNPGSFHLWADANSIMILADNGSDGSWTDFGCYLGKLGALDTLAKPWMLSWINGNAYVEGGNWSSNFATCLKCLAVDESSCQWAHITPTSSVNLTQITAKDNKIIGYPTLLVKERGITQKIVGYMLLQAKRGTTTSTGLSYNTVFNSTRNIFIQDFILPWETVPSSGVLRSTPTSKTVIISSGATTGSSDADADWIDCDIYSIVPSSGAEQYVYSHTVNVDGSVTLTLASAAAEDITFTIWTFL